MSRPRHLPALALSLSLCSGLIVLPASVAARSGGGGHGGGGGQWGSGGDHGHDGGGRAYRFSAPRAAAAPVDRAAPAAGRGWEDQPADRGLNEGYRGSHPLYGPGSRTPWTGHNMSAAQFQRYNQNGWNNNWNRGGNNRWDSNAWNNPAHNFYTRNNGAWNNTWANGGYWGDRPWGYGWYNWSPGTWGWWRNSSPGWGLAALAGADVITTLVNDAASQQSTVIDVPSSDYQLNYATVDSVGSSGADFSYAVAGSAPVKGAANCQAGLIDGQVPSTAAQAQLLNAACQVAYGPDPKGTPLPEALGGALPGWLRDLLILALGGGLATAGWQLWTRRRSGGDDGEGGHHAPVTSG